MEYLCAPMIDHCIAFSGFLMLTSSYAVPNHLIEHAPQVITAEIIGYLPFSVVDR